RGAVPRWRGRHRGPACQPRRGGLAPGRGRQHGHARWPAHRPGPGAPRMSRVPRIAAWWRGREPRERSMLALRRRLLAAVARRYGRLWPRRELREGARAHHAQAVADLATARAGIAALAMSGAVPGPAGAVAGPVPTSGSSLQGRILDSATNAG